MSAPKYWTELSLTWASYKDRHQYRILACEVNRMAFPDILKSITDRLHGSASVRTVYGEPVVVEGKTIIPVAKVRYGFGAGFGEGEGSEDPGHGGGGGGGVEVTPIGIIEITPEGTDYFSFEDRSRMIKAGFALGLIAMFILGRMLLRKRGNQ